MMIQSVVMLFSLVVCIGSYPATAVPPALFGEPQVAVTDCECVLITLLDGNSGKHIGNCLTTLNSEFWCYVTSTSPCSDKKESSRAPGLYYSFQGCKGKLLEEPQPAISAPQQEEPIDSDEEFEP
eukprot:TRINITY_DN2987_c0_g1_i2.p1 TRINITY_DN2987_c0_g1~~TRINITY_DN2987_c0_g1_i2.p1  ORF type:complete len:125 (-),score=19.21 TRINITY_DN2987_c0_g1_i2:91-465(-)